MPAIQGVLDRVAAANERYGPMCFLPPNCVFCRHYNLGGAPDQPDCAAFSEIPDAIFRGELDHRQPVAGDSGIRFELDPDHATDFVDLLEIRRQLSEYASSGDDGYKR